MLCCVSGQCPKQNRTTRIYNMPKTQVLLLCVTVWVAYVEAKPFETNTFIGRPEYERCNRFAEIDITCQKCAKITKSKMAYPMCCTDKEDAYRWCVKYLNFGLQKRSHHHTEFPPPWEDKETPPSSDKPHDLSRYDLSLHDHYLPDIDTNMV